MLKILERAVELAVIALPALPLARLALNPGIRRRFHAFPRIQATMLAAIAAYGIAMVLVAVAWPWLLRPIALAAVFLIGLERWQARSSFGTKRGLPPGSLAFLPSAPWSDPAYYRKQSAAHGPTFKFRHFTEPAVGIVGLERAAGFLRENDDKLLVPPAPYNALIPGGFVRYMEGEKHLDVAAVLRSAFTPAVLEACEHAFADESRNAVCALASAAGGEADPAPVIDRLVLHEMMRCFLGLEPGPAVDRLAQHFEIADYRRLAHTGRDRVRAAILDVAREIRDLADGARANGNGTSFLSELAKSRPDALESDEIVCNFAYTLHTARLDVNGLLVWLLVTLGENPRWLEKLAREVDLDRAAALRNGGLADRIVRETLRLHQSEFLLRRVRTPIEWDGFRIPAQWHVRICVQESHRSASMFENPDSFDPDRFLQPPNKLRYSPFGLTPRLCPGEHLARGMGRHLAVELSRYDMTVHAASPEEFSGFHWRPNSRMCVTLRAR